MSVSLTLAQLLSGLVNSFQSIDIRCAVKKYEPGWLSLLTSIRISARPLEAIQERYQELENDGLERNADPFRMLWQAYPIDQIERILTELASAQLSIERESVRFPEQVEADKLRGQLQYAPSLVMPWDGEDGPLPSIIPPGFEPSTFLIRKLRLECDAVAGDQQKRWSPISSA